MHSFQKDSPLDLITEPVPKAEDPIIDEQARALAKAEAQLKATKAELLRIKQQAVQRELDEAKKQLEIERIASTKAAEEVHNYD